ncbi:MAG TPA: nuclear transport factor 2 family protein [Terracidiphilus sp.]|nr:nuclear transport factor 2 family protein [Terracidiphilus sp.]
MKQVFSVLLLAAAIPLAGQAPPQPSSDAGSATAQKPGDADVIALEQSLLHALASGNTDDIGAFLSPDFISVAGKIHSRAESLQLIKVEQPYCTSQPLAIAHPQVSALSSDVAVIVYQTTFRGTCGLRKGKVDLNITSIWARRNGKWQMRMRTEQVLNGFVVQSGEKEPSNTDGDTDESQRPND